jgi:hypothetical protein
MIVTKKTESTYEIEFDAGEQMTLLNLEAVFEQQPTDMIRNSIDESLRVGALGVDDLVERIHKNMMKDNN